MLNFYKVLSGAWRGSRMCDSCSWNPNLKRDEWDSLNLACIYPATMTLQKMLASKQQTSTQADNFVLFQWNTCVGSSHGTFSSPCRQNHLSADGKEVFLQLMNCSIPYALISSQWLMKVLKESKFCIGKNLNWRRWQLFCPWHRSCPWMFFVSLSISLLPNKWGPIFCLLYCWF